MTDIVERLRKTASRGVSVWGDLQMEAADELERLTTALHKANSQHEHFEREWYLRGDELERLRAELAKPAREPAQFLMDGGRFKLNFNGKGNCTTFQNLAHDLQGRWVALVAAENDRHLAKAQTAPAVPLPDTRKLCTCDGAGRGPGRACVVQAGGRLGDLWRCANGITGDSNG